MNRAYQQETAASKIPTCESNFYIGTSIHSMPPGLLFIQAVYTNPAMNDVGGCDLMKPVPCVSLLLACGFSASVFSWFLGKTGMLVHALYYGTPTAKSWSVV